MNLEGSCHCGAVRFTVDAPHPVPYQRCYCSICRKTAGGGGFAINIGARRDTLDVTGQENVSTYQSSESAERAFCRNCGSALWLYSPSWSDLIHPHASAIDTDLPVPPERTHMLLDSRANWAEPQVAPGDRTFEGYSEESLAAWHERTGLAR
ncbi:GFA family protein [uncultured Jannaschia sp.]|uniref:GFA family protein n=1 Tax=uncultured Jannaschia sp. TaxID=293347 RepID=UPI002608F19A|nr:GFA family protein [uncultured Jannaschia sp.]